MEVSMGGNDGVSMLNKSRLGLADTVRARNAASELEQKYLSARMQSIEHRENGKVLSKLKLVEKLREIKHENEILLNKLISIQKGK
jgi:hypothetical protein